jgi:hypothetical protein
MNLEEVESDNPARYNAVKVECCKHCGSVDMSYKYKQFGNGMIHIECRCSDCDKFQQWARQIVDVNKTN